MVNVRVKGAIRSYAAGFYAPGKLGFYKNENGYVPLAETDFPWELGSDYSICVTAKGNHFTVTLNDRKMLEVTDSSHPYLNGGIGLSVRDGGHIICRSIKVAPCLTES